jgi:hypothetical protein
MRGVVLHAPGDVRLEERDDPTIIEPTDAIIRLSATCICGSDLWPYRGIESVEGHVPMATSTLESSRRLEALSTRSGQVSLLSAHSLRLTTPARSVGDIEAQLCRRS